MADPFLPVTPEVYQAALGRIIAQLEPDARLMPIGGSGMAQAGLRAPPQVTKDVDLVVIVVEGPALRVPTFERTMMLARALSEDIQPRKDQTSVEVRLRLDQGSVRVDLIRGRNPASGGYFVTRRVLETLARRSRPRGALLEAPPEGLAVLKAWAASDQDRLVAAGKDSRGFHQARAAGFRSDVRAIRTTLLDAGQAPDVGMVQELLGVCPAGRRVDVRMILVEGGWSGV